jgi:TonB family protein
MKNIFLMAAFALFAFAGIVSAQELPKVINGGVLNGKAVSLPKPAYPAEAKARRAEGPVSIMVTIDEEGNVIEAVPQPRKVSRKNEDGSVEELVEQHADEALVQAALAAVWEAKFSPTRLSGQPVKVTGTITYNFVAGDSKIKLPDGGIVNDKAESLPAPAYPAAAKAVRASGNVAVQVVIDEVGNIVSATAIGGHPLLRASAVEAARAAKFKPTFLNGEAIKVSGVIMYNFALPDDGTN